MRTPPTPFAALPLSALVLSLALAGSASAGQVQVPVRDVFGSLLQVDVDLGGGTTAYARFRDLAGRPLSGLTVALRRGRMELDRAVTDERGDAGFRLSRQHLGAGYVLAFELPAGSAAVRVGATLTAARRAAGDPNVLRGSRRMLDPNDYPLLTTDDRRLGVWFTEERFREGAERTLDQLVRADRTLNERYGMTLLSGGVVMDVDTAPTTGGPGTPFDTVFVLRRDEAGALGWGAFGNLIQTRARATLRSLCPSEAGAEGCLDVGLADLAAVSALDALDRTAAVARLEARALQLEAGPSDARWNLLRGGAETGARAGAALALWLDLLGTDDQVSEYLARCAEAPGASRREQVRLLSELADLEPRSLRRLLEAYPSERAADVLRRRAESLRAGAETLLS